MKLKLATKQYRVKASDLPSVVMEAINSLRGEWEKTITAIQATLIEDFGAEIAEDLGAEIPKTSTQSALPTAERSGASGRNGNNHEHKWTWDPVSAAVRAWIVTNGAESVKSIMDTNKADVKRILLLSVDEGLTTPQIASRLRQFYTDGSQAKAMRVARTEVSHAAGFGQQEAAHQSGVVKTHSWLSSRDDRVRDEHVAMDTDENHDVPLDSLYSDGSMYPGEQDINCRCVETYGTGR